jgi:hypothetical protein
MLRRYKEVVFSSVPGGGSDHALHYSLAFFQGVTTMWASRVGGVAIAAFAGERGSLTDYLV